MWVVNNDDTNSTSAEPPPSSKGGSAEFVDEHETRARILESLTRIGAALRARVWEEATPIGLNPTQCRILVVLLRSGGDGMSLASVAEQLGVTAPTVSDSVAALEKKGLLTKTYRREDGRRRSIRLTPEGRSAAHRLSRWPEGLLASLDALPAPAQSEFLRSLVVMIRSLQESGQIAPGRLCVSCRFFEPNVHDDERAPHHCRFVDAAFGDGSLRLDCLDHEAAGTEEAESNWERFLSEGVR